MISSSPVHGKQNRATLALWKTPINCKNTTNSLLASRSFVHSLNDASTKTGRKLKTHSIWTIDTWHLKKQFKTLYVWHRLQSQSQQLSLCVKPAIHLSSICQLQITSLETHRIWALYRRITSANSLINLHFKLLWLSRHSWVCSYVPFHAGLGDLRGKGQKGHHICLSRTSKPSAPSAHMGCVLLLQQFAIYQLNRQMLNDFLHLLDWWCCAILDRRPMQRTPPFLHKTPPNTPSPSLFSFLQQVRRQQFKIFLDKLL